MELVRLVKVGTAVLIMIQLWLWDIIKLAKVRVTNPKIQLNKIVHKMALVS